MILVLRRIDIQPSIGLNEVWMLVELQHPPSIRLMIGTTFISTLERMEPQTLKNLHQNQTAFHNLLVETPVEGFFVKEIRQWCR